MKFFNVDCHVSVIADLKNIFKNFGHEVTSWSLSGHTMTIDLIEKSIYTDNRLKFLRI